MYGVSEIRLEFLSLRARSRALADVFEKNEKKNKTTSVYMLDRYMGYRQNLTS